MAIATLETARLVLRPFLIVDVTDMVRILGDGGLLQYFPSTEPMTADRVRQMIDRILAHWNERGYGLWAVERRDSGELIGRAGLQFIVETGEMEIDFILDRKQWGRGLATEAGRASLAHGFDVLGAEEIVGIVHPENLASRRVLEKLGMSLTRPASYFGMECLRYAIDREHYGSAIRGR